MALKKQTFDKAKSDLEKWSQGETIDYDISLTTAKRAWCCYYETEKNVDVERRRVDGLSRDLSDAEERLAEIVEKKNKMVFGDKEIEKEAEELGGMFASSFLFYFILFYFYMCLVLWLFFL